MIKSLQWEIGLLKSPPQNNLNHVYELYRESGSDNENIEDFVKGENKKNSKEKDKTKEKATLIWMKRRKENKLTF